MRVLGSSGHKYDYSKFPEALELPSSQTLGISLQFARTYSKTRNFEKPFVPLPFKLLPLRRAVSVIITPVCRSSRVHKSRYLIFPFYKKSPSPALIAAEPWAVLSPVVLRPSLFFFLNGELRHRGSLHNNINCD